jgi:hypothetical protein
VTYVGPKGYPRFAQLPESATKVALSRGSAGGRMESAWTQLGLIGLATERLNQRTITFSGPPSELDERAVIRDYPAPMLPRRRSDPGGSHAGSETAGIAGIPLEGSAEKSAYSSERLAFSLLSHMIFG